MTWNFTYLCQMLRSTEKGRYLVCLLSLAMISIAALSLLALWKFLRVFPVVSIAESRDVEALGNQLVVAIETFHRDNGSYPISLESLLPRYVSSIPQPAWGVGTWTYRPTGAEYLLVVHENSEYKYPSIVYESRLQRWTVDQ